MHCVSIFPILCMWIVGLEWWCLHIRLNLTSTVWFISHGVTVIYGDYIQWKAKSMGDIWIGWMFTSIYCNLNGYLLWFYISSMAISIAILDCDLLLHGRGHKTLDRFDVGSVSDDFLLTQFGFPREFILYLVELLSEVNVSRAFKSTLSFWEQHGILCFSCLPVPL